MNISLKMLKEYLDLSSVKTSDIKDKLTKHTVEVEQIIKQADSFNNIVVAKIVDVQKHPQADKLQIAIVNDGSDAELRVVCGAPNIKAGQLVPLAKIGAVLPNDLEIKAATIRGEDSYGMLCAEDELGLGDDHDGIMILSDKAKLGQSLADYLSLNDTILEIDNKSISNRPDLWGHYGVARELSVLFKTKLKEYKPKELNAKKIEKSSLLIDNKVSDMCPLYLALEIEDIKVEDSPKWLKDSLLSIGIKPINNIVDIMNYVMFEIGQPLHAFDADTLDKIVVRMAHKGEKIVCLDDQERELDKDDLIISSSEGPLAIAGVIGSKSSEISNITNRIVIESANFNDVSVRKTAQRLNCRTDAAMRFEKGQDPLNCRLAILRAAELIHKICPSAVFNKDIVASNKFEAEERKIELNLMWLEKIVGQKIEKKTIVNILERLGFIIEEKDFDNLLLSVPSWRLVDIAQKEDVVEEIIRIMSYDKIESSLPFMPIIPASKNIELELIKKMKNILSLSYKFNEVSNYPFVSEDQLQKLDFNPSNHIKILNPLSKQYEYLKQCLSVHLIANVKLNQSKYEEIDIFEVSNIFLNNLGGPNKDNSFTETLPYQEKKLGLAIARNENNPFAYLKDVLYNFLQELSHDFAIEFLPTETIISWADKNYKAIVLINGEEVGYLANLSQDHLRKNGIKTKLAISQIDLVKILEIMTNLKPHQYKTVEKFPAVFRDLAFIVDEKLLFIDIKKEIENFHDLIKEIELFDVYTGDNIGQAKKSLAFHVLYQAKDRTLSKEEVDEVQKQLINRLQEKFAAQVRDF